VTPLFTLLFLLVMGAWLGALALGMLALRLLPDETPVLAPLLDLCGTWAGALGILALAFGRVGYGAAWAGALLACALGVTAGLYDRAVLMPSLAAARRRAEAEPGEARWGADWRFLWRLSHGTRVVTLLCALAAIACVAPIPW